MTSKLLSASVLALAALGAAASGSAFAEGQNASFDANTGLTGVSASNSTKTRADVRAELAAAQRAGFNVNFDRHYLDDSTPVVSQKTRAEVKAEAVGSIVSSNAYDHDYFVR